MQREAAAVESVERANGPVAEDALRSLGA
jgi:hypothetical protein